LPKDKEIVPYCWTIVCHLATRAALFLSEQGYRVHELAGGIEYWKNYKMPLEKSKG
jgi:rhodanese-related sulfurtransferase